MPHRDTVAGDAKVKSCGENKNCSQDADSTPILGEVLHISPLSLRYFQLGDTLGGIALRNHPNWDDGHPN